MAARNPIGYLGGLIILIILTSDKKAPHKKKPPKNCTLDYTQPGMHCTASATTVARWDWDQPHVSLLSEPLSSTGFDPRTFRSLGEISTATAAWVPGIQVLVPYIYLSDSSEGASNIKRNLQDSNPGRGHGKAGPYLPGH